MDEDIAFAKILWNGNITIAEQSIVDSYLASCDFSKNYSIVLSIPLNLAKDPEYNVEVAAILSYFGELRRQKETNETISTEKAIEHAQKAYNLIIQNYLVANGYSPKNPRHFKELLSSLRSSKVDGSIYYFDGKILFENGIVTKYE
jgi:hypothetical protein